MNSDILKLISEMKMNVYIYGAGVRAKRIYSELTGLRTFTETFCGFVVTNPYENSNSLFGYSVIGAEELEEPESLIIIGLSADKEIEILGSLYKRGFKNVITNRMQQDRSDEGFFKNVKPDKAEDKLREWYENTTGCSLDLSDPKTFNEKLQWLKLHGVSSLMTELADKYMVREWIKNKIGEQYLIPLLGVWDDYDRIDFDDLPDEFILKCNHGSGWNRIITKTERDVLENRFLFKKWLKSNYAYRSYEIQYKDIKPRLVGEQLLKTDNEKEDLRDYKVFVFGGECKLIQVDLDRFHGHKRNVYTPDWEPAGFDIGFPGSKEIIIDKPGCLEEMIYLAEKLGEEFCQVRVDFYLTHNRIWFGEMTFTHGAGTEKISPEEWAYRLGSWIRLPEVSLN